MGRGLDGEYTMIMIRDGIEMARVDDTPTQVNNESLITPIPLILHLRIFSAN